MRAQGLQLAASILAFMSALATMTAPGRAANPVVSCALPWIYFDLGANTLVKSENTDPDRLRYMPGASDYLTDLRSKGYHLGLLVNIPQAWGDTQEAKFAATRAFVLSHWVDPRPFDWDLLDLGAAFPPTDAQRKPDPYLFAQAAARAREAGCDSVYQSTLPEEIPAAIAAGMSGIRLGAALWDGGFYYPEAKLRARQFP